MSEIDRAVLVLQACDGALFLVSLDTILSRPDYVGFVIVSRRR